MKKAKPVSTATLVKKIKTLLDDNKALDITTINLTHRSPLADYMVIATATSQRHASALSRKLEEDLAVTYGLKADIEPSASPSAWEVLDFKDIIVHIMTADTRSLYSLEELWGKTTPRYR
jgi:ribosome-associated protein